MGIPYDPTKPAAADSPTNDQPIMQSNFASLKTLIDIDHVDFSSAYYGEHNKVTFAADNVPSLPTPLDAAGNRQGILFTNTTSGSANVNQLFYYAGSAVQSSNQYTISGTGSVMTLGGIIIKWSAVGSTNNNATVNFVSAFPNNCFSVVVTYNGASGTPNIVGVNGFTTTGFTFRSNASGGVSFNYIAIGN